MPSHRLQMSLVSSCRMLNWDGKPNTAKTTRARGMESGDDPLYRQVSQ